MAKKKKNRDDFPLEKYEPIKYDLTLDDDTEPDDLILFREHEGMDPHAYYDWFCQIAALIDNYYYALSMEEFMEIFNSRKGYHMTLDEIRQASAELLVFSTIQAEEAFRNGEIEDVESSLYYVPVRNKKTGKEYLACLDSLEEEDLLDYHIELKDHYPVFIPSPEEAADIWENYTPIHTNKYVQKAIKGFKAKFGLDDDDAEEIVSDLWMTFAYNGNAMEKLQGLADDYGLKVSDIKDVQALTDIVMELYNHTNRMENNGWPPSELHEKFRRDAKANGKEYTPTIIPMSSMAADGLKKSGMSNIVNVDFDASATKIPTWKMKDGEIIESSSQKVYPNDPCPCGSGLKYKKCCGKGGRTHKEADR